MLLAEEAGVTVADGQPEAEREELTQLEAEGEDAPERVPLALGLGEEESLRELETVGVVESQALALGWGLEEEDTEDVGEVELETLAEALSEDHREAV